MGSVFLWAPLFSQLAVLACDIPPAFSRRLAFPSSVGGGSLLQGRRMYDDPPVLRQVDSSAEVRLLSYEFFGKQD